MTKQETAEKMVLDLIQIHAVVGMNYFYREGRRRGIAAKYTRRAVAGFLKRRFIVLTVDKKYRFASG